MLVVRDWLKEYIGDSIPSTEKIVESLTLHSFEIEGSEAVGDHEVIDIDILPNRSSDCLCHRGIAREIATLTGVKLKNDPFTETVELSPATEKLSVVIEDTKACRRFGAALVSGVKVAESPEWLKARLEAVGQRSINNVVDITNYVMLSLGQPLHAYDGEKFPVVDGVWKFGVRFAREGEKVTTLSDDIYELDSSIQLITEGKDDTAIGIAGIKGGKTVEVDVDTTTIILEAASFDPIVTRKAARKIKLQTDASKRFENEVPQDVIPHALKQAVQLLEELGGGQCEGYFDEYPLKGENTSVNVALKTVNALLGLTLTIEEVEGILARLGFVVETVDGGWKVAAQFDRTDINIEEDVIEEIGRVYGYEHVVSVVPETVALTELNTRHYFSEQIRSAVLDLGFSEVITSSFRNKDSVKLRNALASDKGCLRSALRKNIDEVLDKNIPHVDLLGLNDVRVLEIGTVFHKTKDSVGEHVAVALGARTKQQGYNPKDDTIVEEAKVALEEKLGVGIDGDLEKGVFEFNLTELLAKLGEPEGYEPHEIGDEKQYKPFSQYPSVTRDIALWAGDGVTADDVESVLNETAGALRVRTTLFDKFSKDGRTSYAFRLVFQSYKKTLTDDEVNPIMERINQVVSEHSWEVR